MAGMGLGAAIGALLALGVFGPIWTLQPRGPVLRPASSVDAALFKFEQEIASPLAGKADPIANPAADEGGINRQGDHADVVIHARRVPHRAAVLEASERLLAGEGRVRQSRPVNPYDLSAHPAAKNAIYLDVDRGGVRTGSTASVVDDKPRPFGIDEGVGRPLRFIGSALGFARRVMGELRGSDGGGERSGTYQRTDNPEVKGSLRPQGRLSRSVRSLPLGAKIGITVVFAAAAWGIWVWSFIRLIERPGYGLKGAGYGLLGLLLFAASAVPFW